MIKYIFCSLIPWLRLVGALAPVSNDSRLSSETLVREIDERCKNRCLMFLGKLAILIQSGRPLARLVPVDGQELDDVKKFGKNRCPKSLEFRTGSQINERLSVKLNLVVYNRR